MKEGEPLLTARREREIGFARKSESVVSAFCFQVEHVWHSKGRRPEEGDSGPEWSSRVQVESK